MQTDITNTWFIPVGDGGFLLVGVFENSAGILVRRSVTRKPGLLRCKRLWTDSGPVP